VEVAADGVAAVVEVAGLAVAVAASEDLVEEAAAAAVREEAGKHKLHKLKIEH
jgi:hypothetical protein